MHFGLALELPDIDLWDIDSLDTHLDSLDTNIPSKYLVCLQSVFKICLRGIFKTCLQCVFKTSLQDVLKTCLQDVFSVTIFRLTRSLQDVLQDVFKTSSRRSGRRKIVTLTTCSRRLQDQQIFAGMILQQLNQLLKEQSAGINIIQNQEIKSQFYI